MVLLMIKITVGIIARNEEKNISATLKNLLNQSMDSSLYEIVVVDGNSTDGTREIADLALKNSAVDHKIINEADHGFYGHCFARNLVIDNSTETADYIAFTDADCIVDRDWLETLYNSINKTDDDVAGAGGPRLIAKTSDKYELVINSFITSYIASGANPAFHKRNVKYTKSIANYNAIYKKSVISKFRYDDSLIISDDNEINFRLTKAGYKFLNVPDAKVWHHETGSLTEFASNMFSYGVNISNTVKKHRNMVTINVPLTTIFIIYLILLIPLYYFIGLISFIPLLIYILFVVAVYIEVTIKTRTIYSLLTFILIPIQHISYGLGVIYNLLKH